MKNKFLNITDEELARMIVDENNIEAFNEIYKRYHKKISDKCLSMVKSKSISNDLTHDVMIKIYENLPKFKHGSTLSTWIYSITYNLCIEYLRKNQRIKYEEWANDIDLPVDMDNQEFEELISLQKNRMKVLLEMINPEDKALLLMKYKDEMPLKKMMEVLKIKGESALKMRLNRAKKRVMALYNEYFL
jgi:RNA polymerase sigma-70 factor (ECF subfamily)